MIPLTISINNQLIQQLDINPNLNGVQRKLKLLKKGQTK